MFIRLPNVQHVNTITHEGKVVIFATDKEGVISYAVKQDGYEDSVPGDKEGRTGWENFHHLQFPKEDPDQSVVDQEKLDQTYKDDSNKYLLRSLYKSDKLSANAPVQVISHMGHLYIFRQSTSGTLLMDRFVLDGMTNTLTRKLEVRFKRSKQKNKPLKKPIFTEGKVTEVDSLDFTDADGHNFYEPTTEILPDLINKLEKGWFSVVLTPTDEQDKHRWHIFAYNKTDAKIELFTLRSGSQGRLTTQDYRRPNPAASQGKQTYENIPGIRQRTLNLQDKDGEALNVADGFSAAKYDVQRERKTKGGTQLLREETRVMLAVPVKDPNGDSNLTATLSFAVAADGTLSEDKVPAETSLRDKDHELMLPTNLLDNIKVVGDASPTPHGVIAGLNRSTDPTTEDQVQINIPTTNKEQLAQLQNGDLVEFEDTASYDGLYEHAQLIKLGKVASIENVKSIAQSIKGSPDILTPHLTLAQPLDSKSKKHLSKGTRLALHELVGSGKHSVTVSNVETDTLIELEPTQSAEGLVGNDQLMGANVNMLDAFEVTLQGSNGSLGEWKKIETEEKGLIFDGQVTQYESNGNGNLIIHARNHGLSDSQPVQITGTNAINGKFPINKLDDDSFTIPQTWSDGEAINISLVQRRGLIFDGHDDAVIAPPLPLEPPSDAQPFAQTISAWIKVDGKAEHEQIIASAQDKGLQLVRKRGKVILRERRMGAIFEANLPNDGDWIHCAGSVDSENKLKIVINGADHSTGTNRRLDLIEPPLAPTVKRYTDYGRSVAISGDWAIVGAPGENVDGNIDAGKAYLFQHIGDSWTSQGSIQAPALQGYAHFGYDVAISEDWAIVGASGEAYGENLGPCQVHFFQRTGNTWSYKVSFNAEDKFNPQTFFGISVAISGDWAIVGAPGGIFGNTKLVGKVYLYQLTGRTWVRKNPITVPKGQEYAGFGRSVAISDDWAIVGASGENVAGNTYAGKAYFFKRDGEAWVEKSTIQSSTPQEYAGFGRSVAISGDWAIVGSPDEKVDGNIYAGKAYLFQHIGDSWTSQGSIQAPALQGYAHFGYDVAISEDWAIVGASGENVGRQYEAGQAYLFKRNGNTWILKGYCQAPSLQKHAYFGSSVAISGDWVFVGARGETVGKQAQAGQSYLLTPLEKAEPRDQWDLVNPLQAQTPQANARFGHSVAFSDDWAIVGSARETVNGHSKAGRAYLFKRDGGSWASKGYLEAPTSVQGAEFGNAVAISGDWAIVGAWGEKIGALDDVGQVYLFKHNGDDWELKKRIQAPTLQEGAEFGNAVAMYGDWAIVGATHEKVQDQGASKAKAGQAYLFKRIGDEWVAKGTIQAPTLQEGAEFGNALAMSGDWAIVGAWGERVDGNSDAGRAYLFKHIGDEWVAKGTIQAPKSGIDAEFGNAVAISGDWAVVGAWNTLQVYLFQRSGDVWNFKQKVSSSSFNHFGASVAISSDWAVVGAWGERVDGLENAGKAYLLKRNGDSWVSQGSIQAPTTQTKGWFGTAVAVSGNEIIVTAEGENVNGRSEAGRAYFYNYPSQFQIGKHFQGKLADVRVWDHARTAEEIKNSMYLTLTGREQGLIGNWRLGGIGRADGKRQVYDFSVHAKHGVVHGDPYAGGRRLPKTLRDNLTPATNYINDELFAVMEGATYEEQFECRLIPKDGGDSKNPKDVNKGVPFKPNYWGKKSRADRNKTPLDSNKPYSFKKSAEADWYIVTGHFTVPEGVRMVRFFDINELAGDDWHHLDIRRYKVKLTADSVTHANSNDTFKLPTLANAQASMLDDLQNLKAMEIKEADLVTKKKLLQQAIVDAKDAANVRAKAIADATDRVTNAQSRVKVLNDNYNGWDSWYCSLINGNSGKVLDVEGSSQQSGANVQQYKNLEEDAQLWRLEYKGTTEEDHNKFYEVIITAKHSGKVLEVSGASTNKGANIQQGTGHDGPSQRWLLRNNGSGHYLIKNKNSNRYMEVKYSSKEDKANIFQYFQIVINKDEIITGTNVQWKIEKVILTNAGRKTESDLFEAQKELDIRKDELTTLRGLPEADKDKNSFMKMLTDTNNAIETLELKITAQETKIISNITKSQEKAQEMTTISTDARKLQTQGALLAFAQPSTRMQVSESCEGRVSLTYRDKARLLRQTHFDCAYDQDGVAEQWLPDTFNCCLAFDGKDDFLEVPEALFSAINTQITIEFWAKGGNALPKTFDVENNPTKSIGRDTAIFDVDSESGSLLHISLPRADGNIYWVGRAEGKTEEIKKESYPEQVRGTWNHWAFTNNTRTGEIKIYHNGRLWHANEAKKHPEDALANVTHCFIGKGNWKGADHFWPGQLAEFRIWNVVLSDAEININRQVRLSGHEPGLVAYYPMNEGQKDVVRDHTGNGFNLKRNSGPEWKPCTIPLARQSLKSQPVVSTEYSRMLVDDQGLRAAMMMRMFIHPVIKENANDNATVEGIQIYEDKRIEDLELIWIGNAQINPTLLGYIEGAPPVPSENLTVDSNYNDASSVELVIADEIEHSWNRSTDIATGASFSLFAGVEGEEEGGTPFLSTRLASYRAGVTAESSFAKHWTKESNVSTSMTTTMTDRLSLKGSPEAGAPKFSHLGQRFVPKNVGYALVVSGMADVFISKLTRTGKMIGYEIREVEGIPPDINTIAFLINPAYTMNGSLDGQTGSQATSNRFFAHVPQMRANLGSLYPASYYRLREAYDLKNQIEKIDKAHKSYFDQFKVKHEESSMNNQVKLGNDKSKGVKVNRSETEGHKAERKTIEEEINDLQDEIDKLEEKRDIDNKDLTTDEKVKLKELKQELKDKRREKQKQDKANLASKNQRAEAKKHEVANRYSDLSQKAHASTSFEGWQKKMEQLQILAGKRNMVNTYVWDADGGFHADEQQFASTIQHIIGGSMEFDAGFGGEVHLGYAALKAELNAQAQFQWERTMTKSETRSRTAELHVDVSGVENIGITDHNDYPLQPGEKVGRYRFMTFYLENSSDNYKDFFGYVVDPEWLASNDEEARAIRQMNKNAPNKVWRILHRVTYVERPSLMGFGRDLRTHAATGDAAQQKLLQQVAQLSQDNKNLTARMINMEALLKKLVDRD